MWKHGHHHSNSTYQALSRWCQQIAKTACLYRSSFPASKANRNSMETGMLQGKLLTLGFKDSTRNCLKIGMLQSKLHNGTERQQQKLSENRWYRANSAPPNSTRNFAHSDFMAAPETVWKQGCYRANCTLGFQYSTRNTGMLQSKLCTLSFKDHQTV